jgi:putative ABC transport system ATP-binding protein
VLLARADRIALVADGRVVARGSHEQLLATEPRYRSVVVRDDDTPAEAGSVAR